MDISNKKILVTGGAGGIGRCLVEKLVAGGAVAGVLDVSRDLLDELKGRHPDLHCEICDVSDKRQVEEAVKHFCEKDAVIDVLVNNAGVIHNSPLVSIRDGRLVKCDPGEFDAAIKVNLYSVFYVTSEVVMKMVEKRTRGVIVNVSSVASSGNAGQAAYSAAKAGVRALTVAWANELSPWNIRVAGIAPGFTRTAAVLKSTKENVLNEWIKKTPSRRMAVPEEIADGILYIIKNDFFNGRILELDGGLRI